MPMQRGPTKIGAMQYNGVTIGEAMIDGQIVYKSALPLPVVTIYYGSAWNASQLQFRQACIDYGTTFDTVENLPFDIQLDPGVNSTNSMFSGCNKLRAIPPLDTSNVTNMGSMFSRCYALESVPPMDTSNVTQMFSLFFGCSSLTSVPYLDTSNALSVQSLFGDCSSLASVPDLNTGKATTMAHMFTNCRALVTAPSLNSAATTNMAGMFYNCTNLTSVPDLNTAKVTTVNEMFRLCGNLTDGNARLIGKRSGVTTNMTILGSGLTRVPFFNAAGNPI